MFAPSIAASTAAAGYDGRGRIARRRRRTIGGGHHPLSPSSQARRIVSAMLLGARPNRRSLESRGGTGVSQDAPCLGLHEDPKRRDGRHTARGIADRRSDV